MIQTSQPAQIDRVRGFVPVAPVGTSEYRQFFRDDMKVPTMIVYGEKDSGLGTQSYNDLKEITTATEAQILKGARHPAYLDRPDEWHKLLYNFLLVLEKVNPLKKDLMIDLVHG